MEQSANEPKTLIVEGIEELVRWRREQAEEYPDDSRNVQSAEGLEALAAFVRNLPDEDERLRELMSLSIVDDAFDLPSGEGERELSQFRFHDAAQDCDAFLSRLVTLASRDAMELARLGGVFDSEDEETDDDTA